VADSEAAAEAAKAATVKHHLLTPEQPSPLMQAQRSPLTQEQPSRPMQEQQLPLMQEQPLIKPDSKTEIIRITDSLCFLAYRGSGRTARHYMKSKK
jgi:hypothetical protein